MTALDDKLLPKVKNLIEKLGKEVTFTVESGGSYDPTTGSVAGASSATHTLKVTPPDNFETKFIDGDVIRMTDLRILIPAKDIPFTPDLVQEVTIDSVKYPNVLFRPIYSGESVVVYIVRLRR